MNNPVIGIIMGSDSDLSSMQGAIDICKDFNVNFEVKIVSAHRTPDYMAEYAKSAKERGIQIIIAGAGGAAHLPGMTASHTTIPVIGVPVQSKSLNGLDSLLSIVQMPGGIPVATVAIGQSKNAGLLAIRILALNDNELSSKLDEYVNLMKNESMNKNNNIDF
ncbi:MAG: 5-(carboxyamino)imidazole ribonucleotide mutase [Ignavibacteriae bacterium]|nr:5-(carboxyamino)imidazole ribonucleotide mutase [Ignavibacteriota bacterium]